MDVSSRQFFNNNKNSCAVLDTLLRFEVKEVKLKTLYPVGEIFNPKSRAQREFSFSSQSKRLKGRNSCSRLESQQKPLAEHWWSSTRSISHPILDLRLENSNQTINQSIKCRKDPSKLCVTLVRAWVTNFCNTIHNIWVNGVGDKACLR